MEIFCCLFHATIDFSMMVFQAAVSYALSCVHQEDLVLKPKQEEVVSKLYEGRDVFAWFPTGYGKTICYQLLPFMFDMKLQCTTSPPSERSGVLIISPLVSLMIDQVTSLQQRGVPAGILSGNKGFLLYLASEPGGGGV